MRGWLVSSTILGMAFFPQVGAAQTTLPPPDTPAADREGSRIEDIIVTAQRREESVQKASISIAVLEGAALEQSVVRSATDLNNLVPGLKIAATVGQLQTFVRGVGDNASNSYSSSPVAVSIDGVYLARSGSFAGSFYDVQRVEVLRGPQGTLYGRNASAGAINLLTRRPELDDASGYVVAQIGNYDLRQVEGMVNLPISPTFGVRAAGQVVRRDGYLSDGSNDEDFTSGRIKALWQPSSDVSLLLSLDAAEFGGKNIARAYRPSVTGNPWAGPNDPSITLARFPNLRKRAFGFLDSFVIDTFAELNWNFGPATLTILPAYRYSNANASGASDGVFTEAFISHQKTLEVRLANESDRLKWVVGGYLFDEDLSSLVNIDQLSVARAAAGPNAGNPIAGSIGYSDRPIADTQSAAVFGEATFSLSEAFRVIGGLRYTRDKKQLAGFEITTTYNAAGTATVTPTTLLLDRKWSAVTWRAGAEFDVGPRSMLFATASKGFKSGGFATVGNESYDPEYLTAFEIGTKNRFFDNRLQANLSAFYWKFKDQQVSFLGQTNTGAVSPITNNAGRSTIYGADFDMIWQVSSADRLSLSGEYLHTNFDEFVFRTLMPGPAPAVGTELNDGCISLGASGPNFITESCTGKPLIRAPEWSATASYSHRFDLANGGQINFTGLLSYSGSYFQTNNYANPNFMQGSFFTGDVSIGYVVPDNRVSIDLWMKNVGNTVIYQTASASPSLTPQLGSGRTGPSASGISAPRTFGARVKFNF